MVEQRASAKFRLGVGGVIVLAIVVLAITIAIGVVRGIHPAEPVSAAAGEVPGGSATAIADDSVSPDSADSLFVHVSGAVVAPGLYALEAGARVADAISRAGGFADDAERAALNLARLVADGEQVHVPRVGEETIAPADGVAAQASGGTGGGVVDLNTADAATLQTLPRIGPALAERIVAWRTQNGRFASVDDLLAVSGIGQKLLDALRDRVRV